jgi:dephospho-CoA kinase
VCYISSSKNIRKERMLKRGDDPEVIDKRIESDNSLFDVSKLKKVNHVVLNENRDLLNLSKEIFKEYKKWSKRRLK